MGELEALLRVPAHPVGVAVVAHPHPLHGGTLHTKVVHRAAKLLSDELGFTALRFNFRGVGASHGTHDDGRGEVDDVLAAVRHVREVGPKGPLVLGGFSFGSLCALRASATARPDLLFLIGIPLDFFVDVPVDCPVVWLHGDADQFGSAERARAVAEQKGWDLHVIEGSDHFFTGRLDAFEAAAVPALKRALGVGVR